MFLDDVFVQFLLIQELAWTSCARQLGRVLVAFVFAHGAGGARAIVTLCALVWSLTRMSAQVHFQVVRLRCRVVAVRTGEHHLARVGVLVPLESDGSTARKVTFVAAVRLIPGMDADVVCEASSLRESFACQQNHIQTLFVNLYLVLILYSSFSLRCRPLFLFTVQSILR